MPEISVLIVNWNGKRFLPDCLTSLRSQTFRDFEVILVDNGSHDGSVAYVRDCFPEVRVIALPENIGFAAGNLAAYEQSTGSIIVLLNNDTSADPSWLSEIHRAAIDFPQAGSFASKMLYFSDRDRIDNCGFWLTCTGTTTERGRNELDGSEWTKSAWVFGACAGAAAYRRTMLEDVGFLDPDFFAIYEDVDLSFRAQLRGHGCVFVPAAVMYHHLSATLQKVPAQRVFWSQRNIEYLYVKNMPTALMLRFAPRRIAYEVSTALYFTLHGHGGSFFKSKLAVLNNFSRLWRERHNIQQRRALSNSDLIALLHREWFGPKWRKLVTGGRQSKALAQSGEARP